MLSKVNNEWLHFSSGRCNKELHFQCEIINKTEMTLSALEKKDSIHFNLDMTWLSTKSSEIKVHSDMQFPNFLAEESYKENNNLKDLAHKCSGTMFCSTITSIAESLYSFGKTWFLVVFWQLIVFGRFFIVFSWFLKYGFFENHEKTMKKLWMNNKKLWKDNEKTTKKHQLPENHQKSPKNQFFQKVQTFS